MALQMGLRRGLMAASMRSASIAPSHSILAKRSFAKDHGDVIGIDLGTTNSCVAIMVRIPSL
jgi:molecular chaperone DnaK